MRNLNYKASIKFPNLGEMSSESVIMLIDKNLILRDINQFSLANFFRKNKNEILNKPLIEILAQNKISSNELIFGISCSEKSFSYQTKLYNPNTEIKYDVIIVSVQTNNESFYVITMKAVYSDSYNDLKAYINAIINNLPGAVYWKDRDGFYMGCNKFVAQMAGFESPEEMIGKTDYDLCWKEFADDWRDLDQEVVRVGKTIMREEKVKLANGKIITELTYKRPLMDEYNQIVGIIGTSLDISDKKALEKQLIKANEKAEIANRARLEFISTASHEIRNPMASIIALGGFLENNLITLRDILPIKNDKCSVEAILKIVDQTFDWCRDLRSESERALSALKNLGALHRMQLNGVKTSFEIFNIQQLIEIAIEESTYPNTNKIEIEKSIHSLIPVKILIDSKNIITALSIVIGNAFRFSHANGKINIGVRPSQKDQKAVLIVTVQDFGVGMHDQQIKNLLTAVLNAPSAESMYIKPSVQLSRVKMYVEASGGELAIKSVLEKGTTVELIISYDLPIEKISSSKMKKANILEDEEEHDVKKITLRNVHEPICSVLLVEDDITIQKITSTELMGLGYDVDVASNGTDAVKMAMEKNYEIILLDISLPDINGLEVMRKIRMSKGDEIIFIALSSHSTEEDEEYFIKQGAMALIAKPLKIKQIKEMMEIGLKIKRKID